MKYGKERIVGIPVSDNQPLQRYRYGNKVPFYQQLVSGVEPLFPIKYVPFSLHFELLTMAARIITTWV